MCECLTTETMRKVCEIIGDEKDPLAGWSEDPYNKTIRTGALMNLSEQERFDDHFPGFPLSMCREFVRAVNQGE